MRTRDRTAGFGAPRPVAAGIATLLALGAALSACGALSDDTASRLLVTPRKYQFHHCKLLDSALRAQRQRIDELERLMARAAQSPAGAAIGNAAYRSDYLTARGEEKEILAAMAEKNCESESPSASRRSIY